MIALHLPRQSAVWRKNGMTCLANGKLQLFNLHTQSLDLKHGLCGSSHTRTRQLHLDCDAAPTDKHVSEALVLDPP